MAAEDVRGEMTASGHPPEGRRDRSPIGRRAVEPIRFAASGLAWVLASMLLLASGSAQAQREPDTSVYVARRGWHIDIGFDAAELAPPLSGLAAAFPGARFLFFGFGDRRYLESRHRMLPALLAALWPGRALILTTGLVATPGESFGDSNVIRLRVAHGQGLAAQSFVWHSLRDTPSTPNDAVRPVRLGPYDGSLYYAAIPTYSAVHTCNTWAGEVLSAAGLPLRSGVILFAWQLWNRTKKSAAAAD